MDGAAYVVADAGADMLPYIVSIDSAVQSIENGIWVTAAILFAFAFAYMAVRWFR